MKRNLVKSIFAFSFAALASLAFAQQKATVTILETSDIHGAIAPWDYATDSAADNGLAKVATIVKQEREKDPNLLLVDCGDNLQDNLIEEFRNQKITPMVGAMNLMKYDVHILGNHEFNFEFENLEKTIKTYKAPTVVANIYQTKNDKRWLKPYVIKKVNGVKIAIIGLLAPHIDTWEAASPDHFRGLRFTQPTDELDKVLKEVEGKADAIVVVSHYGSDGEYGSVGMNPITEKYGDKVAVFLIGHAHAVINSKASNGSLVLEPGSKGTSIAKATLNFEKQNGKWVLTDKSGELLKVKGANVEPDKEIMDYDAPTHEASRKLANEVVGKVGADFLPSLWWNGITDIPTAVVQDTAMMDLINNVQMKNAGADVSMAALFDAASNLTAGDFRKRDGVKVYKFDNTLFGVKVTGKQLKNAMEAQAGNFFNQYKSGDVTISFNPNMRLYLYDMFQGVNYDIDISEPAGSRIKNVTFKGEPLKDDQVLVLAVNNYRYGVLVKNGLISGKPEDAVFESKNAVRDMISDYVKEQGTIMPDCDNNWKITGTRFPPESEKVWQMLRDGKLHVEGSADGRTPNIKAINIKDVKIK